MSTLTNLIAYQTVIWLPMLIAGFCMFKMRSHWRWLVVLPIFLLIGAAIYGNFIDSNTGFAVPAVLFSVIGCMAGALMALLLQRKKPEAT